MRCCLAVLCYAVLRSVVQCLALPCVALLCNDLSNQREDLDLRCSVAQCLALSCHAMIFNPTESRGRGVQVQRPLVLLGTAMALFAAEVLDAGSVADLGVKDGVEVTARARVAGFHVVSVPERGQFSMCKSAENPCDAMQCDALLCRALSCSALQ